MVALPRGKEVQPVTATARSITSAGFALPRDADRRSAFQAVPALFLPQRYVVHGPAGRGAGLKTGGPFLRGFCEEVGEGPPVGGDVLAAGGAAWPVGEDEVVNLAAVF